MYFYSASFISFLMDFHHSISCNCASFLNSFKFQCCSELHGGWAVWRGEDLTNLKLRIIVFLIWDSFFFVFATNDFLFLYLQFDVKVMEMEAITRAARLGRTLGESPRRQNAFWHFFDTGGAFDILVQLWIITMSCVRILPPYGVPGAGRAAEDGDGLLGRLRGDARLHRQLRLHLPRLGAARPALRL